MCEPETEFTYFHGTKLLGRFSTNAFHQTSLSFFQQNNARMKVTHQHKFIFITFAQVWQLIYFEKSNGWPYHDFPSIMPNEKIVHLARDKAWKLNIKSYLNIWRSLRNTITWHNGRDGVESVWKEFPYKFNLERSETKCALKSID